MATLFPLRSAFMHGQCITYRIPVFTKYSYEKLVSERSSTYIFELFTEVCREENCIFQGLKEEFGYVYVLIGIIKGNENEKRPDRTWKVERSRSTSG